MNHGLQYCSHASSDNLVRCYVTKGNLQSEVPLSLVSQTPAHNRQIPLEAGCNDDGSCPLQVIIDSFSSVITLSCLAYRVRAPQRKLPCNSGVYRRASVYPCYLGLSITRMPTEHVEPDGNNAYFVERSWRIINWSAYAGEPEYL